MKATLDMQYITADLSKLPRSFSDDVIAGRVESGPLQINDDWPSCLIRGDNAAWYAMQLDQSIIKLKNYVSSTDMSDVIMINSLESLSNLLKSCLIERQITNNISEDDVGC